MSFPPISELLPHRPPMLWLDEVVWREGDDIQCRLQIRESHVFVEHGKVESMVAVEWMAQAVGALVGLYDRYPLTRPGARFDARAEPPRPGYLIAIPEAHFVVAQFEVGDIVDVHARRAWGDSTLGSFEARCVLRGEQAATATLSVYRRALHEQEPTP